MYLPPAIHHFPNTLDLSVRPKVSGSLLGTTLLGELFAELFGDEDEEDSEEDTNPVTRWDGSWSVLLGNLAEMKKTMKMMTNWRSTFACN
jgi:hypothetical protein